LLLILAKCISVTSPFILKTIVNSLAVVSADGGMAAAAGTVVAAKRFTLVKSLGSIGLWGLTRIASSVMLCYQMNYITEMIQVGIKKLSSASFKHLHKLDLNYHKTSSKNTVFGINRALRSIDSGLRFLLGFFAQMAIEFLFLSGTLYFYCGKKYLFNMLVTFVAYTLFTNKYSEKRI